MVYEGPDAAQPYGRTLRLARNAHPFYAELVRTYDQHGYSPRVHEIARRQLNRAANALADLIRASRAEKPASSSPVLAHADAEAPCGLPDHPACFRSCSSIVGNLATATR